MFAFLVKHGSREPAVSPAASLIVERCISAASGDDQAAMMLSSLLSDAGELGNSKMAAAWLRISGISALRYKNGLAFEFIVRHLVRIAARSTEESDATRALASLCAASLRFDRDQFAVAWKGIESWLAHSRQVDVSARLAMQVGASALDCADFSALLICVNYAKQDDRLKSLRALTGLDRVLIEAKLAELSDVNIGRSSTTRLEQFRDFVVAFPSST
jgi:hypothetical protein